MICLISFLLPRSTYFGGWHYDAPNYPNFAAFAAVKADGSIIAWGSPHTGGMGAPSGSGYTKIYSNGYAFAALKANGSITAWGSSSHGGAGAPSGNGYTKNAKDQHL
jgi:alpha-tubulin suppressor-like RCC1 family protein